MTETSFPIKGKKFSTADWRSIFGAISGGIAGDYAGDAYAIVRGVGDSATVSIMGSDAVCLIGGFAHSIPVVSEVKSSVVLTVPAPTSQPRTDLIVARFNPANEAAPGGPISLALVSGTEGNPPPVPTVDGTPPGLQDVPLWSVTRSPGSTMATATIIDLRVWVGRHIRTSNSVPGVNINTLVEPIGTTVAIPNPNPGGYPLTEYRRILSLSTVIWQRIIPPGALLKRYKHPTWASEGEGNLPDYQSVILTRLDVIDPGVPYCISGKANCHLAPLTPPSQFDKWTLWMYAGPSTLDAPYDGANVVANGTFLGNAEAQDPIGYRCDLVAPPSVTTFTGTTRVYLVARYSGITAGVRGYIGAGWKDFWVHPYAATID